LCEGGPKLLHASQSLPRRKGTGWGRIYIGVANGVVLLRAFPKAFWHFAGHLPDGAGDQKMP